MVMSSKMDAAYTHTLGPNRRIYYLYLVLFVLYFELECRCVSEAWCHNCSLKCHFSLTSLSHDLLVKVYFFRVRLAAMACLAKYCFVSISSCFDMLVKVLLSCLLLLVLYAELE